MKRIVLGVVLLIGSAAAWSLSPCCSVVAINAKTGVVSVKDIKTGKVSQYKAEVVSVKDVKTGKVSQYKAEPAGIKGLKVGDKVDLVGGQLRTVAGATIAGRVQP